jgi:NAD(P)-dependent dehydrogenase (short-subunit alcohol dehydrogenase family)
MATYLITGCSQGIGLALAAYLAGLPSISTVFASARRYSPELKTLVESSSSKVVYVYTDVEDESSVQAAAEAVEKALDGKGLDVLVNNVGMNDVEFGSVLNV